MTIIQRLDGKTYDFDKAEIRTLDFIVESPNYSHNFQEIEGRLGAIDTTSSIGPRRISAEFLARSGSIATFSLLRDEIFEFLRSNEPFWLIEKRSTNKKWLVKVDGPFSIPQKNFFGKFSVDFIAFEGVAKSPKTTLQLEKEGILNNDFWSYGMGLETVDNSELLYTFTGKTFKVFNAGNVDVHPFESYLKIQINKVVSGGTGITLINKTNGSRFKFNKLLSTTDNLLLDGPVVKRNSLLATRDTTKEFVFLSPGWNTFEIQNASSATISFDFNFIYL